MKIKQKKMHKSMLWKFKKKLQKVSQVHHQLIWELEVELVQQRTNQKILALMIINIHPLKSPKQKVRNLVSQNKQMKEKPATQNPSQKMKHLLQGQNKQSHQRKVLYLERKNQKTDWEMSYFIKFSKKIMNDYHFFHSFLAF